jgi:hypothetical protein
MQGIYSTIKEVRGLVSRTAAYIAFSSALAFAGCVAEMPDADASGAEGETAALAVGPIGAACTADADCRIVPDYCAECACVALGAQQQQAECFGEQISCVLNPCAEHVAMCVNGHCSAESGTLQ